MAVATLAGTGALAQETTITVDPIVKIAELGAQADVSGTLTCPSGWIEGNSVQLAQIQKGGKLVVFGGAGSPDTLCSGDVQHWELVLAQVVPLKPGHATALAFISAFNPNSDPDNPESDGAETSEAVKIQRAR